MPDPKDNATGDTTTAPPVNTSSTTEPEVTALTSVESTVANLADLKSALPKADADFYVKCLEASMTVDQAQRSWIDRLQAKNEAQTKEIEIAKAKQDPPGVDGLDHSSGDGASGAADGSGTGDAQARWNDAIKNKTDSGMSRSAAAAAVNREDPQLREDMITEVNIAQGRARAVA